MTTPIEQARHRFLEAVGRSGIATNNRAGGQWILCATDEQIDRLIAGFAALAASTTPAESDWLALAKIAHDAWRGSVIPSFQGPEWETLGLTPHLQWMAAAEAVVRAAPVATPAPSVGWMPPISTQERMPKAGTRCLVFSKATWEKAASWKFDTWAEQHEAPLSFSSATVPIGLGWDEHLDAFDVTFWLPEPPAPEASPAVTPKEQS
jgi:hypothetical protein